ncbi:MAG: hypothetical protein A2579_09495 [Lysobacterales bacterium RIFOXYD1_FULL_69_11]|nr:MAG: hypothetical protein A2190_01195 [Xanthomonadales bacterium RIFOXYA1_FULL_69_10]OHE88320.1 MAG: hypothetical protein A2579_09495 [Xanthomonadales bacterium RIFOXYD1_FULL_69_11]
MPHRFRRTRIAVAGALAVTLLATSGCSWFRKGDALYAQSPESRPLEVPPDLDLPRTAGAAPQGSVTASGQSIATQAPAAPAPAPAVGASAGATATATAQTQGFTTSGTRDEVYARVGELLGGIEGVEIASRAELLGAYDVNYEGANFLVRVSEVQAGAYVSAVDPRGMPATGDAPAKLIAALQGAIGGN